MEYGVKFPKGINKLRCGVPSILEECENELTITARNILRNLQMCRYLVTNFMASLPKIDSPTRQLITFSPIVLRPSRLRTTSSLVALRHDCYRIESLCLGA